MLSLGADCISESMKHRRWHQIELNLVNLLLQSNCSNLVKRSLTAARRTAVQEQRAHRRLDRVVRGVSGGGRRGRGRRCGGIGGLVTNV